MRPYKWDLVAAGIALCVLAAYLLYTGELHLFGNPSPRERPIHAIYIWQHAWNDEVRDSLPIAANQVRHFMVLAHEEGLAPIDVDWEALAATNLRVTLVFRYSARLGDEIAADSLKAAQYVGNTMIVACEAARMRGARLRGVQLDFDSPSHSLKDYSRFARRLQHILPAEFDFSITTLPAWLDDTDFSWLVDTLDYYVLKTHAFEPPQSIDAPMAICDTGKIEAYAGQMEGFGIPYYIAFPTHGYEAAFDATGAFIGLSAEGRAPAWPPGSRLREVRADPAEIAAAVNRLAGDLPSNFRGAVWFRMPVASDTRNWTWPVLTAVMEGRVPSVRFSAEVRNPEPDVAEIWLASIGEDRPQRTVDVAISLSAEAMLAAEPVSGFHVVPGATEGEIRLRGDAPVGKEAVVVARYRMRDERSAREVRVWGVE